MRDKVDNTVDIEGSDQSSLAGLEGEPSFSDSLPESFSVDASFGQAVSQHELGGDPSDVIELLPLKHLSDPGSVDHDSGVLGVGSAGMDALDIVTTA